MDESKMQAFRDAAEAMTADGYDATADEYSGRGMYGRYVPSITTSHGEMIGAYLDKDLIPHRTDSMGMSTVYY